ncbi:hypothetical protein DFH27DRAFT_527141 [Peziza echinospora]|nr:hypothetical protein DFH27DRAFT_527141 [Peziza echinospora]
MDDIFGVAMGGCREFQLSIERYIAAAPLLGEKVVLHLQDPRGMSRVVAPATTFPAHKTRLHEFRLVLTSPAQSGSVTQAKATFVVGAKSLYISNAVCDRMVAGQRVIALKPACPAGSVSFINNVTTQKETHGRAATKTLGGTHTTMPSDSAIIGAAVERNAFDRIYQSQSPAPAPKQQWPPSPPAPRFPAGFACEYNAITRDFIVKCRPSAYHGQVEHFLPISTMRALPGLARGGLRDIWALRCAAAVALVGFTGGAMDSLNVAHGSQRASLTLRTSTCAPQRRRRVSSSWWSCGNRWRPTPAHTAATTPRCSAPSPEQPTFTCAQMTTWPSSRHTHTHPCAAIFQSRSASSTWLEEVSNESRNLAPSCWWNIATEVTYNLLPLFQLEVEASSG